MSKFIVPFSRILTCIQSRKKICLLVPLSSYTVGEMITFMPLLLSLPLSSHIAIKEQASQLVRLLITLHSYLIFV